MSKVGGSVFMKLTIYIHSEYIWPNKVFYILHLTHRQPNFGGAQPPLIKKWGGFKPPLPPPPPGSLTGIYTCTCTLMTLNSKKQNV